jgi:hypothetical protein
MSVRIPMRSGGGGSAAIAGATDMATSNRAIQRIVPPSVYNLLRTYLINTIPSRCVFGLNPLQKRASV